MLDTKLIRSKIDRLSAADGADTYWRETMLEALREIDLMNVWLEELGVARHNLAIQVETLKKGLLNRARDIEHDLNPGEISDEANYLRRLVTSDIGLEECQQKLKQLELEIEAACQFCCGYCKNQSVADADRDPSNGSWYHLTRESSTGRWYCAASPIRERRYQARPVAESPTGS